MKDAGQLFPSESLSDQEQSRLQKKLAALRERRIDPFPRAKRNHSIAAARVLSYDGFDRTDSSVQISADDLECLFSEGRVTFDTEV